ncbi:uncharacterized protein LOC128266899 [Anopheles cruzii]|uniref:uncharacterized protein LOC128266899 n=1 Tax=Anopheles cruzii TaxID=68878 RepID=UPI0022EC88CF|nr:uncharacterized protein LOC128266899 [Anopheles cruzii]
MASGRARLPPTPGTVATAAAVGNPSSRSLVELHTNNNMYHVPSSTAIVHGELPGSSDYPHLHHPGHQSQGLAATTMGTQQQQHPHIHQLQHHLQQQEVMTSAGATTSQLLSDSILGHGVTQPLRKQLDAGARPIPERPSHLTDEDWMSNYTEGSLQRRSSVSKDYLPAAEWLRKSIRRSWTISNAEDDNGPDGHPYPNPSLPRKQSQSSYPSLVKHPYFNPLSMADEDDYDEEYGAEGEQDESERGNVRGGGPRKMMTAVAALRRAMPPRQSTLPNPEAAAAGIFYGSNNNLMPPSVSPKQQLSPSPQYTSPYQTDNETDEGGGGGSDHRSPLGVRYKIRRQSTLPCKPIEAMVEGMAGGGCGSGSGQVHGSGPMIMMSSSPNSRTNLYSKSPERDGMLPAEGGSKSPRYPPFVRQSTFPSNSNDPFLLQIQSHSSPSSSSLAAQPSQQAGGSSTVLNAPPPAQPRQLPTSPNRLVFNKSPDSGTESGPGASESSGTSPHQGPQQRTARYQMARQATLPNPEQHMKLLPTSPPKKQLSPHSIKRSPDFARQNTLPASQQQQPSAAAPQQSAPPTAAGMSPGGGGTPEQMLGATAMSSSLAVPSAGTKFMPLSPRQKASFLFPQSAAPTPRPFHSQQHFPTALLSATGNGAAAVADGTGTDLHGGGGGVVPFHGSGAVNHASSSSLSSAVAKMMKVRSHSNEEYTLTAVAGGASRIPVAGSLVPPVSEGRRLLPEIPTGGGRSPRLVRQEHVRDDLTGTGTSQGKHSSSSPKQKTFAEAKQTMADEMKAAAAGSGGVGYGAAVDYGGLSGYGNFYEDQELSLGYEGEVEHGGGEAHGGDPPFHLLPIGGGMQQQRRVKQTGDASLPFMASQPNDSSSPESLAGYGGFTNRKDRLRSRRKSRDLYDQSDEQQQQPGPSPQQQQQQPQNAVQSATAVEHVEPVKRKPETMRSISEEAPAAKPPKAITRRSLSHPEKDTQAYNAKKLDTGKIPSPKPLTELHDRLHKPSAVGPATSPRRKNVKSFDCGTVTGGKSAYANYPPDAPAPGGFTAGSEAASSTTNARANDGYGGSVTTLSGAGATAGAVAGGGQAASTHLGFASFGQRKISAFQQILQRQRLQKRDSKSLDIVASKLMEEKYGGGGHQDVDVSKSLDDGIFSESTGHQSDDNSSDEHLNLRYKATVSDNKTSTLGEAEIQNAVEAAAVIFKKVVLQRREENKCRSTNRERSHGSVQSRHAAVAVGFIDDNATLGGYSSSETEMGRTQATLRVNAAVAGPPDYEEYRLVFVSSDSSSKEEEYDSSSTSSSHHRTAAKRPPSNHRSSLEECDWDYFEPDMAMADDNTGVRSAFFYEMLAMAAAAANITSPPPSTSPSSSSVGHCDCCNRRQVPTATSTQYVPIPVPVPVPVPIAAFQSWLYEQQQQLLLMHGGANKATKMDEQEAALRTDLVQQLWQKFAAGSGGDRQRRSFETEPPKVPPPAPRAPKPCACRKRAPDITSESAASSDNERNGSLRAGESMCKSVANHRQQQEPVSAVDAAATDHVQLHKTSPASLLCGANSAVGGGVSDESRLPPSPSAPQPPQPPAAMAPSAGVGDAALLHEHRRASVPVPNLGNETSSTTTTTAAATAEAATIRANDIIGDGTAAAGGTAASGTEGTAIHSNVRAAADEAVDTAMPVDRLKETDHIDGTELRTPRIAADRDNDRPSRGRSVTGVTTPTSDGGEVATSDDKVVRSMEEHRSQNPCPPCEDSEDNVKLVRLTVVVDKNGDSSAPATPPLHDEPFDGEVFKNSVRTTDDEPSTTAKDGDTLSGYLQYELRSYHLAQSSGSGSGSGDDYSTSSSATSEAESSGASGSQNDDDADADGGGSGRKKHCRKVMRGKYSFRPEQHSSSPAAAPSLANSPAVSASSSTSSLQQPPIKRFDSDRTDGSDGDTTDDDDRADDDESNIHKRAHKKFSAIMVVNPRCAANEEEEHESHRVTGGGQSIKDEASLWYGCGEVADNASDDCGAESETSTDGGGGGGGMMVVLKRVTQINVGEQHEWDRRQQQSGPPHPGLVTESVAKSIEATSTSVQQRTVTDEEEQQAVHEYGSRITSTQRDSSIAAVPDEQTDSSSFRVLSEVGETDYMLAQTVQMEGHEKEETAARRGSSPVSEVLRYAPPPLEEKACCDGGGNYHHNLTTAVAVPSATAAEGICSSSSSNKYKSFVMITSSTANDHGGNNSGDSEENYAPVPPSVKIESPPSDEDVRNVNVASASPTERLAAEGASDSASESVTERLRPTEVRELLGSDEDRKSSTEEHEQNLRVVAQEESVGRPVTLQTIMGDDRCWSVSRQRDDDDREKSVGDVTVVTGANTLSAVVCLEDGLADDDSWVEEISQDEEEFATTTTATDSDLDDSSEEMSFGGSGGCNDREEELRGYNRTAIDFTLHTIVEESCEESEIESRGSSAVRRRVRRGEYGRGEHGGGSGSAPEDDVPEPAHRLSASELEKYFFYGLGGGGSGGGTVGHLHSSGGMGGLGGARYGGDDHSELSEESSSLCSDGHDSLGSGTASGSAVSGARLSGADGGGGGMGDDNSPDSVGDLASSRLEKYFLTGFLGYSTTDRGAGGSGGGVGGGNGSDGSGGSVGSDSEGHASPEQRRKRLVRARGATRSHNSLDNLLLVGKDTSDYHHHPDAGSGGGPSGADLVPGAATGGSGGDMDDSSETDTCDETSLAYQERTELSSYDSLGKRKKKYTMAKKSEARGIATDHQSSSVVAADGTSSVAGGSETEETRHATRQKLSPIEMVTRGGSGGTDGATTNLLLHPPPPPPPSTNECSRKQNSRDSGFIGSNDDLLKEEHHQHGATATGAPSSTKVPPGAAAMLSDAGRFELEGIVEESKTDVKEPEPSASVAPADVLEPTRAPMAPGSEVAGGQSAGLPKKGSAGGGSGGPMVNLVRKDSFNNWSSDEETNLMMSKMRQFFKSLVAASANTTRKHPSNSSSSTPGVSGSNTPQQGGTPVARPRGGMRTKPPQLVYFENELTRLMKTVPGIRDEQVREIVEYLSSEETWSDSYDSSDYTSSDLEGNGATMGGHVGVGNTALALQQEISASCRQIINKFDSSVRKDEEGDIGDGGLVPLGGAKAKEEPLATHQPHPHYHTPLSKETAFVYQRLVASLSKVVVNEPPPEGGPREKDPKLRQASAATGGTASSSSPPLIAKVMHHIGSRLVALMHEVSSGEPHPSGGRVSPKVCHASGREYVGGSSQHRIAHRKAGQSSVGPGVGASGGVGVGGMQAISATTTEDDGDSSTSESNDGDQHHRSHQYLPQHHHQHHHQHHQSRSRDRSRTDQDDEDQQTGSGVAQAGGGGGASYAMLLPRSKSHDLLLGDPRSSHDRRDQMYPGGGGPGGDMVGEERGEASDYERFSWRGSFESALLANGDSRTKLSMLDNSSSSRSVLVAKRRSAGDLLFNNQNLSQEQLDRVRSCGSIGGEREEFDGSTLWDDAKQQPSGQPLQPQHSAYHQHHHPQQQQQHQGRRRTLSSVVADDADTDSDESVAKGVAASNRLVLASRSTLPRSLQNTITSATTNSLPRLPTSNMQTIMQSVAGGTAGGQPVSADRSTTTLSSTPTTVGGMGQKSQSVYHHFLQNNVKSARYRAPGFSRTPPSAAPPKRAMSAPGLQPVYPRRERRSRVQPLLNEESHSPDLAGASTAAGEEDHPQGESPRTATSTHGPGGSSYERSDGPDRNNGTQKAGGGGSSMVSSPVGSTGAGSSENWPSQSDEDIDRLVALHQNRASLSSLGVRSDSMASVYSGAGEGRYGTVTVRGQIEFGMQYNYKQGALEIHVKQCKDLAAVDTKRNRSDPYVKVYLLPDKSKGGKRKTKVKKHTLNPVFDEVLRFHMSLSSLQTRTIWATVWHSDMFGRNDFLGEVMMGLQDKVFDNPQPQWYQLQERSEPFEDLSAYKGDIIVGLKYVSADGDGSGSIGGGSNATVGGSGFSTLNLRKFSTRSLTSSSSILSGHGKGALHVLVKEAKHLQPIKSNGTCDAFCKSYLLPDKNRSSKQKTPVIKRTNSPIWNYTFVYEDVSLAELSERALELTIWDHDRLASNEFLGGVRFSLGNGKHNGRAVEWMDSTGKELSLWQNMINRPNFWVEGALVLRPSLDNARFTT